MDFGLYVVATPIGRINDITISAVEVLKRVDFILCEDTRVTSRLLRNFSITAECLSLHKFNEASLIEMLLDRIAKGHLLALVSDAGTPAIHDPGYRLVAAVQQAKLPLSVIPGASSVTAALSVAGCMADCFSFLGFLPSKPAELKKTLIMINTKPETVVCFESPHRIKNTLTAIADNIDKARLLVLCKELTKIHESITCLPVSELANFNSNLKGEWVLIFKPFKVQQNKLTQVAQDLLTQLVPIMGVSQSVKVTKAVTGGAKNALYHFASELKNVNFKNR